MIFSCMLAGFLRHCKYSKIISNTSYAENKNFKNVRFYLYLNSLISQSLKFPHCCLSEKAANYY